MRVQSLTTAFTYIFGSALVNDVRFTYLRRKFIDERAGAGMNLAREIGLAGVSDRAFPAFTIPGYASLSSAAVARVQTPIVDQQITDSLVWSRGRHAYKFGGEFRAGANDELRDRASSGSFSFSPLVTSNIGVAETGNSLATFMLGEVDSATVQISDVIRTRASYVALYAQDDWRANNRLTLNYGLRWEVEFPRREVDNKLNSFDPTAINPVSGTPGVVTFAGVNGTPERAFAPDLNNFGPRFGFAYQLDGAGRTVLKGGAGIFYGPTVSNSIGDVAALGFSTAAAFISNGPGQSVFRLQDGVPAYSRPPLTPALGAVPVGRKPNTTVAFFDPHEAAPTSYQTNVNLQRELGGGTVVDAGYLGNVGRHLTANDLSLNQVAPDLMGPGNAQIRRPFRQFTDVVLINPAIGRSSYHAGFVRVQKRFDRGFSLLAHYTRSRYLDNAESANEYGNSGSYNEYGNSGSYVDAYHRELDWAQSASDVPHHFVMSVLYEVPSRVQNRVVSALTSGWHIGIVETLQSGPPFTVVTSANTTNAFPAGPLRPNLVGDPALSGDERTIGRWFNTSAFVNPALYAFGNSPRSVLRGPGIATTDLTLERSVAVVAGTVRLELRGEAYNLLNHTNFNVPGYTLGAPNFGVISSARPARTIQLGARLRF